MYTKKNFASWFIDPVRNQYADFEGRTGRKEFWMFILTSIIFFIGLSIISSMLFYSRHGENIIVSLAQLAIMVPSWAITARRLHDIGKSGWWQLIGLIPVIGTIILILWLVRQGDEHANAYGSKPHMGGRASHE